MTDLGTTASKNPEIVDSNFKPFWKFVDEATTEEMYHADRTALSRGDIVSYLRSPAHFYEHHFGEPEKEPTEAMKFGTAAHTMLLEPEKFRKKYIEMPDFGDFRSSKNKAERDAWLSDQPPGAIICTKEDLECLVGISQSLLKHPIAKDIFKDGVCEAIGYYRDPVTGFKCRVKPDFVSKSWQAVVDFKTARDARKHYFSKTIWENRYDIQLAMYSHGVREISNWQSENRVWVVAEKKRPYPVWVYVADKNMNDIADSDYRKGLDGILSCLVANNYNFYQEAAEEISLPRYAIWEGQ